MARGYRARRVHVLNCGPVRSQVALVALKGRREVTFRFAGADGAVVACSTAAGDFVVVKADGSPAGRHVTCFASVRGGRVIARLAVDHIVVVAGKAGCGRGAVVHADDGPVRGDMAGLTLVRCRQVAVRFA